MQRTSHLSESLPSDVNDNFLVVFDDVVFDQQEYMKPNQF